MLPPRRCNGSPAWSCVALGSRSYPPVVPAATRLKAAPRAGAGGHPRGPQAPALEESLLSGSEGLPSAGPLFTGASRVCLFLDLVCQSSWRTSVGFIYLLFLTSVYLFTYFWAAPGLCCCTKAVPGCREQGRVSSCGGWASHRRARRGGGGSRVAPGCVGSSWTRDAAGTWALAGGFSPTGRREAQLGFRWRFLTSPLQDSGFSVLNPPSLFEGCSVMV